MNAPLLATTGHGLVSETVSIFIALLGFAATVAVLTKFIRIPYTVALVLAGLTVAILKAAPPDAVITEELVIVLFLPPLLFQAGLHLDLQYLQRKAVLVTLLAVPGVALTSIAVALAIEPLLPEKAIGSMSIWLPALLFGAMFATTDPISVLATFKTAGAPQGLKTVVEGESLFNDGTGVVLFLILLGAVFPNVGADALAAEAAAPAAGPAESITIADGIMRFIKVAGLGLVFGLGFGLVAFWLLLKINDHVLENAITIVLVWGSFIIAERSGVSGVIAVVVAGLIIGNHGKKLAMDDQTRQTINTFWESIDFVVNSIVFLLIGFELQFIGGLAALVQPQVLLAVGAVYLAMMIARAVMVYPMALTLGRHWPWGWKHVIFWAGIKGAIPMALVLGLPQGQLREFLIPISFGIVLVSLMLQGLTMPWLMKITQVSGTTDADIPQEARATT